MTFGKPLRRSLGVSFRATLPLLLAGLLGAGLGRDASASTIYTVNDGAVVSNIDSLSDITNSTSSNLVGFSNGANPNLKYAQGFTSTGTAGLEVTKIVLGLGAGSPVTSALVQIYTSVLQTGTAVPGTALATFTLTGTAAVFDADAYTFAGSYTLAPSTNYWVVVSDSAASSSSSFGFYNVDTSNVPTGSWGYSWTSTRRSRDGINWQNFVAGNPLSIQVVAVPEPESVALLGVGAATVAGGIVRRRKRTRR